MDVVLAKKIVTFLNGLLSTEGNRLAIERLLSEECERDLIEIEDGLKVKGLPGLLNGLCGVDYDEALVPQGAIGAAYDEGKFVSFGLTNFASDITKEKEN